MLDLSSETITDLPIDQLGLAVLEDIQKTGQWSEHNYLNGANQSGKFTPMALRALAEATGWLRSRALIARDPAQSSSSAIFVTRAGQRVLEEGPRTFYTGERLQGSLHPWIDAKARPQFLIGEYEQAVFAALKAVEVRVRKLAVLTDEDIGVSLINKAFGPKGALTDPSASKGEQEGTRALFAGAYAVFRNPVGHRDVDYDDIGEAAEAVQTASLLMRILDRVETRLPTT